MLGNPPLKLTKILRLENTLEQHLRPEELTFREEVRALF